MTLLIVAVVVALLAGAGWAAALGADDTGEMTQVRRGVASGWDITVAMSRLAMWATTLQTRPRTRVSPWAPSGELGIDLGYTKWFSRVRRRVLASFESVVLVVGPPGTGKSGLLAAPIAQAPGPIVAATTAIDLHRNTHESRARLGPVWVVNPDSDGEVPTTGVWPIVPGCEDPEEARRRAIWLINGAATDNLKDAAYWEGHARRTLYCMLLAAALEPGATMLTVASWATTLRDTRPYDILQREIKNKTGRVPEGWPGLLKQWHSAPPGSKLLEGVESILQPALEFMAVPTLAACVLPRPGVEVFDAETLIRNNGTLYIVARHEEGAPSGPFTAALTAHLHHTAVRLGARERLDPPLGEILDEPAHTARVPLPEWTATARKSGIYIVVGYQDPSQLRTMFGEDGAATVEANAVMKIGFNSVNDKRHLEYLSMLAGSRVDRDGDRPTEVPVLKPEHIKNLPDGEAVAIYKNHRPVIFTPQPVWDRKPVKRPTTPPRPTVAPEPAVVDLNARRDRRKGEVA